VAGHRFTEMAVAMYPRLLRPVRRVSDLRSVHHPRRVADKARSALNLMQQQAGNHAAIPNSFHMQVVELTLLDVVSRVSADGTICGQSAAG
jgi:hypothetical protein